MPQTRAGAERRRFWRHWPLAAGAALAIAGVLAQTTFYLAARLYLGDVQMRLLAPPQRFDKVLVVDVDEESMARLADQLGPWPYRREVYALAVDYLARVGARAVVFDILFSEPREGDEEFAAALGRTDKVVLAVSALPNPLERSRAYHERLSALAWRSPARPPPAYEWPDFTLPLETFASAGGGARLGVISVLPDPGGVLRRVPLLHEAYGRRLPSLPLAALFAAQAPPELEWRDETLRAGPYAWPLRPGGDAELLFPSGTEKLPVLSFYQLVLAAMQTEGYRDEVTLAAKDRTVFIGSSAAILGDYTETPVGRMPGLHALAIAHSLLADGQVLAPHKWFWDLLLVAIALVIPLAAFDRRLDRRPLLTHGLAGVVTPLLVAAAASILYLQKQQNALLFAMLAGLLVYLLLMLQRLAVDYQIRQRLQVDKLAAEEAYRLKERFMAHMTHELRTPLTAIMGFNKLQAGAELPPRERMRYVDIIDANSRHLLALVNNILDQSRIEAGQMKIVRSPVPIRGLVEEVAVTLSAIAAQKNLTLTPEFAPDLPQALALDPLRVKQILINLTGNAIKFTATGGVRLECAWREGALRVAVADTGPGMNEEQLGRIFTAFAQADDSVAQKHGGSGLGLSISLNLCRLMGGRLEVRSIPGAGSTFSVVIPAERCQYTPPEDQTEHLKPPEKLAGTVLLADDSEDIRDLVAIYLRRMGLKVLLAANGREALELAFRERPDLVLSDMEMPEMDGPEAIRQLRNDLGKDEKGRP